jgi:CDP-4-dehydro-6-deoxyglucose reductase
MNPPSNVAASAARPVVTVQPAVTVQLRHGETVLEGLYREGYAYLVGCRRGGCGICKADLLAGSVSYPTTVSRDVLSDYERADGTCLTCRAVPAGDVTIALRGGRLTRNSLLAGLAHARPTGVPPECHQTRSDPLHGKGEPG